MAFPASPLGTAVEIKINNAWTNVVRYDTNTKILQKDGVQITRGAGGLQDKTPASTCRWTWQDPNGIFNNENPRSPYYGLLVRNTPVRVYVPRTSASLYVTSTRGSSSDLGLRCSCPDTAATSPVGDIDIRIDIEPKRWARWGIRNATSSTMVLASKWAGAQRCWTFILRESGSLLFFWSNDGSAAPQAGSTAFIDMTAARLALRVTIDVDNGAAGKTVTFYTAPTMAGPWTVLGAPVTTAGTTSIFDSNAKIELGTIGDGTDPNLSLANLSNYIGRIYGFQLYNSAAALVANADFTGRANGTTSFADGLGNTWTVATNAEITNADYRFYGELSAPVLKPNRSKNGAGLDVQIEAEAGGIIRRLSANDTPLQSAAYRFIAGSFAPTGWWTGEDSSNSDTDVASSAIAGSSPATIQDITFNGPDATLPGSAGVMVFGSTGPQFVGVPKSQTLTTETHFFGLFKFPTTPVAEVVLFQMLTASSTIVRWNFCVSNTSYILRGYNSAGTEVATKSSLFGVGTEPTKWIAYHMQLTNVAGTVTIKSEWTEVNSGITFTQNPIGTLNFAGSNGVITSVIMSGTGLSGLRSAHLVASNLVGLTFYDGANPALLGNVLRGYRGETADARFIRICTLLGVTPVIFGWLADSEQMGAEPLDTGINILYECVAVGGGVMLEAPDLPNALEYHTLKSIYNQRGTLSLTWAQVAQGLEGTPDDTDIANDITLHRANGGSARATLEFGPMSILAPPNGINPVPDGPTINNYQDSRLTLLVQQMLQIRTWPTSRYPKITVNLEHPTFSANTALGLLAQRQSQPMMLTITALPTFMPPDTLYVLVKGITEQLLSQQWKIEWACVPYGPYINSELNSVISGSPYQFKAGHTTISGVVQQQLNAGITNSATSFAVKTLSGVLFDTAAVNIPIKIGGELMTVGSVTGATSPQTMNSVTRGVNGYAAAHNANDPVIVYPLLKARL